MTRPSFSDGERRIERVERPAAGRQSVQRLGVERETRAAVLHQHAGCRQHAAGTEFPIERLDVGDDEARCIRRAHPDGVARALRRRPARGFFSIDLLSLDVEKFRCQKMGEIAVDLIRIGDKTVAHAEGALGGFDEAVNVIEAFGLADTQAIEQRQNHERCQALRRRRRVVERAGSDLDAERLGDPRLVFLQIGARHRAADALQVGGDLAADIAAIEIVEAGLGEMLERGGEGGLLELGSRLRRLAVNQERLQKARRGFELGVFFDREARLARRDDVALAGALDGGFKQHVQRQLGVRAFAGLRLGGLEREHPSRHRARHGERGERAARRNLVVAGVAIKPRRCFGAGAAGAHDGAHAARRLADQPEAVAADVVHVRIDRGNRRRHRQHGLDGVAAFGEDGAAVLDRGGMRGGNDAAAVAGGVQVHAGTASASPRFFSSASTAGRRPRKAL